MSLDPKVAARVGKKVRRAEKEFYSAYEALDPEDADKAGIRPGSGEAVKLWFEWRPYGWGAEQQWAHEATKMGFKDDTPMWQIILKKIVVASNFGLEEHDYVSMQPGAMDWVLQTIQPHTPDQKKSRGSFGEESSKEPIGTQDSPTTS